MKKRVWIVVLILFIVLFIAGCEGIFSKKNTSKERFKAVVEDNVITLTCKKADKDSTAKAIIVVEEDEELVIHTNLEKLEKVNIKVYPVKHKDSDEPLVDLDGFGVNPYSYPLDPGEYEVVFTALNSVNGSIDVSVE